MSDPDLGWLLGQPKFDGIKSTHKLGKWISRKRNKVEEYQQQLKDQEVIAYVVLDLVNVLNNYFSKNNVFII